jgi:hypothetical protein
MTGNPVYVRCPVLLALAGAHGHRETIHSALEVTFNQSGGIAWRGANAIGYQVRSMVGEVDVMITSTVLYFIWGDIEAEAQSDGKVIYIEKGTVATIVSLPAMSEHDFCRSALNAHSAWQRARTTR